LKKLIALLVIFHVISLVNAQVRISSIERITLNDGISDSRVTDILQDKNGFIWFATKFGLNRYTGGIPKIYKFSSADPGTITANELNTLHLDPEGTMWVGTEKGLARYNPEYDNFSRISLPAMPENKSRWISVNKIASSRSKNGITLWLATSDGLQTYETGIGRLQKIPLDRQYLVSGEDVVNVIFEQGKILVHYAFSGLFIYDQENKSFVRKTEPSFTGDFDMNWLVDLERADDTGYYLFFYNTVRYYTAEELFSDKLLDLSRKTFIKYTLRILDSEKDKDGNIWISNLDNGVEIWNPKKNIRQIIGVDPDKNDRLSYPFIYKITRDNTGIMWMGTNGAGVNIFNPYRNRFNLVFRITESLTVGSLRSFYEDEEGNLFVSGYNGLFRFSNFHENFKKGTLDKNFRLLNTDPILVIKRDLKNRDILWLGSDGSGIYRYNKKSDELKKYEFLTATDLRKQVNDKLTGHHVYGLHISDDGLLYIGTDEGLNIFNPADETFRYVNLEINKNPYQNNEAFVFSVIEDKEGNIWIATQNQGVVIYNKNSGKITHVRHSPSDPNSINSDMVRSIMIDDKGKIWMATSEGICLYNLKENKAYRLTQKDGLKNSFTYGIISDPAGRLWISSNGGLFEFDPAQKNFRNYTVKDGLQDNEFNTNAYYKSPSGIIYFGGIKGFNFFDPMKIERNTSIPRILITGFKVFDDQISPGYQNSSGVKTEKTVTYSNEITLAYDQNNITLEFIAADYSAIENNEYIYKLEGFDREWSAPSTENKVKYTNLPPGEYTFIVKGSNGDGLWNDTGASIKITVTPPFWLTWWFIIAGFLVFTGLAVSLEKYRNRIVKGRQEKLENLIAERTLELKDVNESLQQEIEIRKQKEEELQLVNSQREKFFSIVTHDLKSPFFGLQGYSEILINDYQELTDEERLKFITEINEVSKSSYNLLENLLNWSRLQAGRMEFNPKHILLNTIVENVMRLFNQNAVTKNIALINKINEEIIVHADENMLNLILRNLIGNSIKFTPNGGAVAIYTTDSEQGTVICVKDTGVGMSREAASRLFRVEHIQTTLGTEKEKGSGLGLLLCLEMVQKHGGTIRVESEPGEGSTFMFNLPRGEDEKQ